MMDIEKFEFIKKKYGHVASWAVWKEVGETPKSNMGDLNILDPQQNPNLQSQLKPDVVFVGLNISMNLSDGKPFCNFHPAGSRARYAQDYKTRFALKDTELWGGYMTDIIKHYPELHGQNVVSFLRDNPDIEKNNIKIFREELKDLGSENPTIIAFGIDTHSILTRNLNNEFNIVQVTHYSYQGLTKENFREEIKSLIERIETSSDSNSDSKFIDLIQYIKEEHIVYPMTWHEFYVYIKDNVPRDVDVPVPFILGASGASDNSKREQFIKQIEIANKYGLIHKVSSHIMNLSDDQLVRHETKDVDPETGNLTSNPEYFPHEEYERIHLEEEVFGKCVEYLKQLRKLGNNYVNSVEYFNIFFLIFEETLYSKKQQKIHENNLKKIKSYSKKLNEWYDLEDISLQMEVMKENQKNIESEILIYKIYELYTSLVNKDLIDDGLDFCETLFYYLEEEND
jgi:hypothetical protein